MDRWIYLFVVVCYMWWTAYLGKNTWDEFCCNNYLSTCLVAERGGNGLVSIRYMFYVMAYFLFRPLVNKKENSIALGCHPFLWVVENVSTPKHCGAIGGNNSSIFTYSTWISGSLKWIKKTVTKNYIHEHIISRLNSGNVRCHFVRNILLSLSPSNTVKLSIYKIII